MNQTFMQFIGLAKFARVAVVAALMLSSIAAFAQITTSTISGVVTDASGEGLPGATVVATHLPSGSRYGASTNVAGRYVIPGVRVGGPFKVEISYTGYETQTRENLYTSLGTATDVKVNLQEASSTLDEATIIATKNDVFSSDRNGTATSYSERVITQVPIVGSRSISEVTKYTPFSNGRSFGGQDSRLNNFTVDGSQFNNGFGLGAETPAGGRTNSTAISLDAIQEVQVNTAPYDVRQSNFVGAGINAVTRSGNNEFEGSVYTFWRDNSSTFNGNSVDGREVTVGKFKENIYGFRIGGPLIKDKLFFFANYEQVRRTEPAQTWFAANSPNSKAGDQISRVEYTDMVNLSNFLRDTLGYETGAFENYDDQTNSDKFLIRLDYNLAERHRLTLRYTHHDSDDYVLISNSNSLGQGNRRTSVESMSFQNSGYIINDNTRSIVGEWNWNINDRMHNNFIVGYDKQDEDRGAPGDFFPTVDIRNGSSNYISFGYDPFTPSNKLDYGTFHITNNLSYYAGRHTLTGGVNYEHFKSNNLFFPGSNGVYVYNSLNDFYSAARAYAADPNNPVSPVNVNKFQFRYSALEGGAEPLQIIEINRVDLYAQDEYAVTEDFNLLFGLRTATIFFKNTALQNETVAGYDFVDIDESRGYDINTGELPKTQFLVEPRLGFNWDVDGNRNTQLRGGTGIFTGRPAYVWVSNQIGNNGILTGFIDESGVNTRPFRPFNDASQFIPENPTFPKTIEIAQTDPNFKFQQVWKSNLGLDQRIGNRLIASGEVLFTKNINAPVYFNANLEPATTNFAGPDDRLRFNGGGLNTGTPKDDTTRINNNISTAVVLDNVNEGYYFGVTGLLEYPAVNNRGFYGKVGYTYSRTKDLQSAGSIAAGSWTNSFSVNGNNNLELSFSDNDTPHRIFGLMGYTIDYGGKWGGATSISLGYIGQRSGRVSYAYAGDMNGDNVSNNDLIYVPNSASELNFQSYSVNYVVTDASGNTSTVTKTFTVDEQVAAFDAFIDQDEYLSTRRGRYAERNGGLFPWLHRFDLSIMQEVFLRTGREDKDRNSLQFRVDILNFGNLLNDSWGVGKTLLTNRVLSYRSLNADGEPVYRFGTQTINGVPELQQNTFINSTNVSNVWQAQFGLRYTFGR
jgi:hypothetical protein